jgi:hypothetical protein
VAVASSVGDLSSLQQRFGGDAATVQAGATQLVLLYQDDRQTELGSAQGAGVTTGAATEDHQIGGAC